MTYINGWVPCSSGKFPKDGVEVQVTYFGIYDNEPYCNEFAYRQNGVWYWSSDDGDVIVKIIAWKRMCEPYVGEKIQN